MVERVPNPMGSACSVGGAFHTDDIHDLHNKLIKMKEEYPWAGQLSDSQLLEIDNAFSKFDRDRSGTIESKELKEVMRSCGLQPTNENVEELLRSVDTDNNGKIEYEEFMHIMAKRILETDGKAELEKAFELFDPDQKGYIDVEETTRLLTEVGKPFSDAELRHFLGTAKADKDGRIDREAFLDMACWRLPADLFSTNAKSRTSPETSTTR